MNTQIDDFLKDVHPVNQQEAEDTATGKDDDTAYAAWLDVMMQQSLSLTTHK
jgi:hypothetical protein